MGDTVPVPGDEFLHYLSKRIDHLDVRYEKLQNYSKRPANELNDDQLKALQNQDSVRGSLTELRTLKTRYEDFLVTKSVSKDKAVDELIEKCRQESKEDAVRDVSRVLTTFLSALSRMARDPESSGDTEASKAAYSLMYSMFSGSDAGAEAISNFYLSSAETVESSTLSYAAAKEYVSSYEKRMEAAENVVDEKPDAILVQAQAEPGVEQIASALDGCSLEDGVPASEAGEKPWSAAVKPESRSTSAGPRKESEKKVLKPRDAKGKERSKVKPRKGNGNREQRGQLPHEQ